VRHSERSDRGLLIDALCAGADAGLLMDGCGQWHPGSWPTCGGVAFCPRRSALRDLDSKGMAPAMLVSAQTRRCRVLSAAVRAGLGLVEWPA